MLGKNLIQAAAGNAGGEVLGVEDVFSTWLYTGNGSTQTITNGIDLSGEGGLVWTKGRSVGYSHALVDTERGRAYNIKSNSTAGNTTAAPSDKDIVSFGSSGYSLGADWNGNFNTNGTTFASWTFRKAPGFFDVVTYTGNGADNRTISHNLGSMPGFIIVKQLNGNGNWAAWHRSLSDGYNLFLNLTNSIADPYNDFENAGITSTGFTVNATGSGGINGNNNTYVAYLFAHDAGGFGDSGNDSVVSCGGYTGNGSATGPVINLGWEPQWVMIKATGLARNWVMCDVMRGMPVDSNGALLAANLSDAEITNDAVVRVTSTGFQPRSTSSSTNDPSQNYIYIAIRRGPMKTPTDATTVFSAIAATNASGTTRTVGFAADMSISNDRTSGYGHWVNDRLRGYANTNTTGASAILHTESTAAEDTTTGQALYEAWNTTIKDGAYFGTGSFPMVWHHFRRAPGFFDVVAYTGTGVNRTVSHNLGVAPELMIIKRRNSGADWPVYTGDATKYVYLNDNYSQQANTFWNNTAPTSSVFSLGTLAAVNASGSTYIAYLFASCPGVSKIGSYTGTGTTLSVDCGFTNGARFVLIRRLDDSGDTTAGPWYVWDTARGIVAGNDPYLLLNSTAAEVTSTDYIDPLSSGFQISSTAPAAINASGGTFVFLAIS